MPGYEVRREQIEMAEAIESAISHSEQLIVEAGTGIGKSFAYLVPLAEYALQNKSLGIVSTNTISLQEQIIHKDFQAFFVVGVFVKANGPGGYCGLCGWGCYG